MPRQPLVLAPSEALAVVTGVWLCVLIVLTAAPLLIALEPKHNSPGSLHVWMCSSVRCLFKYLIALFAYSILSDLPMSGMCFVNIFSLCVVSFHLLCSIFLWADVWVCNEVQLISWLCSRPTCVWKPACPPVSRWPSSLCRCQGSLTPGRQAYKTEIKIKHLLICHINCDKICF